MTIAQGVSKQVAAYKQTGLGVPRSGNGAQLLRRETSMGKLAVATYENNEITSHQQSTGKTHGGRSATYVLNGLLSGGTYKSQFESLLRAAFATTTPITAAITIAGSAGAWTLTDAANGFLAAGVKIGDVIRITAGTYANAVNRDNNILVTGVTATVITGATLNASVLIAEGPIAASTITIVGKKCKAPLTSHTKDYWTVEDYQSDLTAANKSELFTDLVWTTADIGLPSTGSATLALNAIALNRTAGAAQVLTTPTAETTSEVVESIRGLVRVGGATVAYITGATLKIDAGVSALGSVLGSNVAPDVQWGITKVSGQITAFWQDGVLPAYFDAATPISVIFASAVDTTNASEFITFSMSKVTLDSDDKDDGVKGIVRTYAFTAEINGSGGAALANDQTLLTVQDSLA